MKGFRHACLGERSQPNTYPPLIQHGAVTHLGTLYHLVCKRFYGTEQPNTHVGWIRLLEKAAVMTPPKRNMCLNVANRIMREHDEAPEWLTRYLDSAADSTDLGVELRK